MNRSLRTAWIVSVATFVLFAATTSARAIVPINGVTPALTIVPINTGPGNQIEQRVSGDVMAYTDNDPIPAVLYYRFSTGTHGAVPKAFSDQDRLPSVDGNRIVFTRLFADGRMALMLFDTSTSSLVPINLPANSEPFGSSLAGNTLAYVNIRFGGGNDVLVFDLATMAVAANLSAPGTFDDFNPHISPDGNVVVWTRFASNRADVMKSIRSGGVWGPAISVTNALDFRSFNPDTDGVTLVFSSNLPGSTDTDIYLEPLVGSGSQVLEMPSSQGLPRISKGVVAFLSRTAATASNNDIFIYVIATNTVYQITDTPSVNELAPDIDVLPNGDIRLVWQAGDGVPFGDTNIYATTLRVPLLSFQQVSAGLSHTCMLRASGEAECFGNNAFGQAPTSRRIATVGTYTSISAAATHTCALSDAGSVECWGNNTFGQAPATRTARTGRFTQLSSGGVHNCALRDDGVVECWGSNALRQAPASRSATLGSFVHVAAGTSHTCALRDDGVVECWGFNALGQAPAFRTASVGSFTSVTAGGAHTCGTRVLAGVAGTDGVECWGTNLRGQAPAVLAGRFESLDAGGLHTCGIGVALSPPLLSCVGDNALGQAPPTRVPAAGGGDSFVSVSAGAAHTCAINRASFIECWGNNTSGQAPAERR